MKKVIIILGFLLIAVNAEAGGPFPSAVNLFNSCQMQTSRDFCAWYLLGVAIGHTETARMNNVYPHFCMKKGTSIGQFPDILRKYAEMYPNSLAGTPMTFILDAFRDYWPCEKTDLDGFLPSGT